VKSRLGRFAEAESDIRSALLNRLKATGKYHLQAARFIATFGSLLIEQGRFDEARELLTAAIGIYRELGIPEDSQVLVYTNSALASVLALEEQWTRAEAINAAIARATGNWEPARREHVVLTHAYIETLFKTGKTDESLAAAKRLFDAKYARYGARHADTSLARGHYAVALARTGKDAEAIKEFEASVPALTATSFETDNDDVVNAAARVRFTQVVVENYIALLARMPQAPGFNLAAETFRLADSVRSRAVQKALTAAGARMNTADPQLAEAVRLEQDLRQQIGTHLDHLNGLLALPAAERDDAGVTAIRKAIDKMRGEHTKVRADIDKRFPNYSDLIDPKPPTAAEIKDCLKPGEALLSFYFGREASFVWVIAADGKTEFAALPEGAASIESKIKKLREALEPQAAMISDVPKFDLALSYSLFKTLLEPVKPGWSGAKNLIVVTNGALGLLPLGLLTTAPYELKEDGPLFSGYRSAPWLARTHAVTMVPSASALRTLRRLPEGSQKRQMLIAFGDPLFNPEQAAQAQQSVQVASADLQTRGVPLTRRAGPPEGSDSVGIADLPRLPDTADELRSIALALHADPTKALHLGKFANEQVVKTTDLSGFKIVAFATHGLVPGEIDGLDQPALALSAPDVAGVEGDGLLTMQEILSLKLDADWVVLSACNTGAAAGAGAEAASGLGRAFFYAGTRAILVTNWSVHSLSARQLVTDLFRREAENPSLGRGQALQQAMMALMDGKGYTDETGKTLFAYAHPLFWAPYTIIGDGN
jgi:CHAT domain-containing protein